MSTLRAEKLMGAQITSKMFVAGIIICLAIIVSFIPGCGNPVEHIPEFKSNESVRVRTPIIPAAHSRYRLLPYDEISVRFTYHPEHDPSSTIPIRPDGNIVLEGIGSVRAVGLTPEELSKVIAKKSLKRMKHPEVVVTIIKYSPKKIFVGGEVRNPGVVLMQEGMTPLQAIFERGGFTTSAQMDSVVLIRDAASGNPQIGKINLSQAMEKAVPERVTLFANDVLYVPLTGVGRADLWVRQHIKDLIPWQLLRPPGISSFIN